MDPNTRSILHKNLSSRVKTLTQQAWTFIELGQHQVKGKQKLIEVYSLEHDLVKIPENERHIADLIQQREFNTIRNG